MGSLQDPKNPLRSSHNNAEVRVTERQLRFFGQIAHNAPDAAANDAVAAVIPKPPLDWKQPPGRPNHM